MSPQQRVRRAVARHAILDQMTRYIQAVDRCDLSLLKSVFHPDGQVRFGVFNGNAHEFCAFNIPFIQQHLEMGWHRFSNVSLQFQDDSQVLAESSMLGNAAVRLPGGELINCPDGMRYLDVWERREGTWRMASRDLVLDWNANLPCSAHLDPFLALCPQGRRGREDLAYRFELLP